MNVYSKNTIFRNRREVIFGLSESKLKVYGNSIIEAVLTNDWSEVAQLSVYLERECDLIGAFELSQHILKLQKILNRKPLDLDALDTTVKYVLKSLDSLNAYLRDYLKESKVTVKRLSTPPTKSLENCENYYEKSFDYSDEFSKDWKCTLQ